jgi:5-methylcytosine-specific restriction endonuclease McrA
VSRAQLRAEFFVAPDGSTTRKAPPLTTAQRKAIFARDGFACQYCGAPVAFNRPPFSLTSNLRSGAVDHVFARARGGQNDAGNLRLACESCNAAKGAY